MQDAPGLKKAYTHLPLLPSCPPCSLLTWRKAGAKCGEEEAGHPTSPYAVDWSNNVLPETRFAHGTRFGVWMALWDWRLLCSNLRFSTNSHGCMASGEKNNLQGLGQRGYNPSIGNSAEFLQHPWQLDELKRWSGTGFGEVTIQNGGVISSNPARLTTMCEEGTSSTPLGPPSQVSPKNGTEKILHQIIITQLLKHRLSKSSS